MNARQRKERYERRLEHMRVVLKQLEERRERTKKFKEGSRIISGANRHPRNPRGVVMHYDEVDTISEEVWRAITSKT